MIRLRPGDVARCVINSHKCRVRRMRVPTPPQQLPYCTREAERPPTHDSHGHGWASLAVSYLFMMLPVASPSSVLFSAARFPPSPAPLAAAAVASSSVSPVPMVQQTGTYARTTYIHARLTHPPAHLLPHPLHA